MQQVNDAHKPEKGGDSPGPAAVSPGTGDWYGAYLLVSTLVLTGLLVVIWPSACATPSAGKVCSIWNFSDLIEVRLLAIVLVSGALGSSIFAARAYATFRGLKRYDPDWNWWYIMRLPVGMGLALFLYLVIRGGLFSSSFSNSDQVMNTANPFGFAALAALAGMFAKEASDKLEEIFQAVFRTSEKPQAAAEKPAITKLEPAKKAVKDADLALVVIGRNFDSKAKVTVGDKDRAVKYKDPGRIEVTLTEEDLAAKAKLPVVVVNPAARGGASAAADLAVG